MSFAAQLDAVRAEVPSLVAGAFSRMAIDDPRRWEVHALLDADVPMPAQTEPLRVETLALRAGLRLTALERPASELLAALAALEGSAPDPSTDAALALVAEAEARDPLGREVLAIPDPAGPAVEGADAFLDRLDAIRAQRPWRDNPTWQALVDGTIDAPLTATFVDQWRIHLSFGPALFAGMLGNLPPADPDTARLRRNVADSRRHLADALRQLRVELVGDPGPDNPVALPETAAHLALMGEISRHRPSVEAFAAVLAQKPGFGVLCGEVVDSLRTRRSVSEAGVEFFVRQRDRGDDGETERAAVRRVAAEGPAARPALATAFRDGLSSYHLVLDGCHRASVGRSPMKSA